MGPPEGVKVWVGGLRGKKHIISRNSCRFPSNVVGLIPRGLEPEVVHMDHVALVGLTGRARGEK